MTERWRTIKPGRQISKGQKLGIRLNSKSLDAVARKLKNANGTPGK